ncbi:MAG: hypothetical protein K8R54_10260 [Bacteroidales bacterium]|nr:hypothetical protein [Bacteroidales bacterium]
MKVSWTPEATETFEQTIENIYKYWTQKEVIKYIEQTEKTIEQIQVNPYMFIASNNNKQIRKGFINRLSSMFYKVNEQNKEIEILSFWNNRQNPEDNKFY